MTGNYLLFHRAACGLPPHNTKLPCTHRINHSFESASPEEESEPR
jgi:hypothetical protein